MKIRALVVEAKDAPFKLQEIELAEPGRGEELVRVAASGVCHTDAITRAGDLPMPFHCVLGHEGSGTVERVGPGVTTIAPGDKVIIGWHSCGECRNRLDGHPRYCLRTGEALVSGRRFKGELKGTSAYSRDGKEIHGHFFGQFSFAMHSVAAAAAAVKVPDSSFRRSSSFISKGASRSTGSSSSTSLAWSSSLSRTPRAVRPSSPSRACRAGDEDPKMESKDLGAGFKLGPGPSCTGPSLPNRPSGHCLQQRAWNT